MLNTTLPPQVPQRPTQVKTGKVVSDKMAKTVIVQVNTFRRHPLYGQVMRQSKRYMVHDEQNASHIGDEVRFCLCRPISRHKSWVLMEITRPSRSQMRVQEENTSDYRQPAETDETAAPTNETAEPTGEATMAEEGETA
jgi:small subunit ribosomal protein S17